MIAAWLVAAALAETPLTAGAGHATTVGRGHGAVGLFRPLTVGVSDRVDLGTSGLATLVAPRIDAKVALVQEETGGLAVTGGVGVPTVGLRLLRGTVLPSDPTLTVGLGAVAKVGAVATLRRGANASSLGIEARFGGHGGTLGPVDAPFLGQSLAPLLEGPVLRARWVTDLALAERLVITSDLAVQVGAGGPDVVSRFMLLGGLSQHVALGAGWAIADETTRAGRDSFGVPLLDVIGRW